MRVDGIDAPLAGSDLSDYERRTLHWRTDLDTSGPCLLSGQDLEALVLGEVCEVLQVQRCQR